MVAYISLVVDHVLKHWQLEKVDRCGQIEQRTFTPHDEQHTEKVTYFMTVNLYETKAELRSAVKPDGPSHNLRERILRMPPSVPSQHDARRPTVTWE